VFYIYTKEEADAKGFSYLPWHEAKEGEYAISDDEYVSLVRSVKSYDKKNTKITSYEVKLPFGVFWYDIKNGVKRVHTKCNYEDRKEKKAYSVASNKSFGERMVACNKMRKMARMSAYMLVQDGAIDYKRLGELFFSKHLIPEASVKRVLRKKEIMEYIEGHVEKQLAKWGVDDETIIKRCFIQALEIAEMNKDADILLKIGKELATLKNMYPNKKLVTNQLEVSRDTTYLDAMVDKVEDSLQLTETIQTKE